MKLGYKIAAVVGVLMLALSACNTDSKYTEPFKDAPRSGVDNNSPMNVINMSDGFSNLGWKCLGKDGIYDAYHGNHFYGAIFVVPNDPNCIGR